MNARFNILVEMEELMCGVPLYIRRLETFM